MKVLHIDTGKEWRGGQRQVYFLGKALYELGIEQVFLVSNSLLKEKLKALGFKVFDFKYRFEFHYKFFYFIKVLRVEKPSIVHFHDARSLSLVFFTRLPSVATRRVVFPLKTVLSRLKYRKVKRVVSVSNAIKELLFRYKIDSSIIHDGVSEEDLKTEKSKKECRKIFGFRDKPVFISVGALSEEKGYGYLLSALEILKKRGVEPEVHIAGDGELKKELLETKEQKGLRNVFFHGFVKNISEFYRAGDIFIITPEEEGLNSSIIDAMALKIPVIATKTGGISEVLDDSGILAESKNPSSIAEKILYAIREKEMLDKITEKAYMRFKSLFHYRVMAKKYKQLYFSLLKE